MVQGRASPIFVVGGLLKGIVVCLCRSRNCSRDDQGETPMTIIINSSYCCFQLGYEVDPDSLVIFPKPGSFPSRTSIAYQLLADRKAMLKSLNARQPAIPTPFSFAREVQKRVAAACGVVGNDATPFHWASDMTFGVGQSGPAAFVSDLTPLSITTICVRPHFVFL